MTYNTKNYTEQGGEKIVIGGELEIKDGAVVTGLPGAQLTAATETAFGGIKAEAKTEGDTVPAKIGEDGKIYVQTYPVVPVALTQADSTATEVAELVTDFNALLLKLKTAGLMESE